MSNKQRLERTTPLNWGGVREKSGRRKLAPSSSVRIDRELLRQVRRFMRFNGNPRELVECAVRKELLERQTARDAHLRVVALGMYERNKANGRASSALVRKLVADAQREDTPQHKNAI